jgi:alpha-tubulin suppressor-like RCC1 family protein
MAGHGDRLPPAHRAPGEPGLRAHPASNPRDAGVAMRPSKRHRRHTRVAGLVAGAGMLLGLAGCVVPRTEVIVRVESDLPWGEGAAIESVVLEVRRGGAAGPIRSLRTSVLGRSEGRRSLPLRVWVLESSGDVDTPLWVEALGCASPDGCTRASAVVAQRAVVRFQPEQTLELPMLLAAACVGVRCRVDERCRERVGTCRPAEETVTTPWRGLLDAGVSRDVAGSDLPPAADLQLPEDRVFPDADDVTLADGPPDAGAGPAKDADLDAGPGFDASPEDVAGACELPRSRCGEFCLDTRTQALHCGACGRVCPRVTNGVASCAAGQCRAACATGFADCNGDPADGCETSVGTSANHCGACGRRCAPSQSCAAGTCVTACPAGQSACGGACAPPEAPCTVGTGACQRVGVARCQPGVTSIALGDTHVCILRRDGGVWCQGGNQAGQLGDGTTTARSNFQRVRGLNNVVEIDATASHVCARASDGTVQCWGSNHAGQLGDGSTTDRASPVPVDGITTAVQLSSGASHRCARLANGTVRCWGSNQLGQLGNGSTAASPRPVTVATLTDVVEIASGSSHTCARLRDGTVRCWGLNSQGVLGIGPFGIEPTPVAVAGLANVTKISAGLAHHCARLADQTLRCWGANLQGELGNGSRNSPAPTPTMVAGLAEVRDFVAGSGFTCAALPNGSARCWGNGAFGSLGALDEFTHVTPQVTPVMVTGLTNVQTLFAGGRSVCAILTDDAVWCWGANASGQLGDGSLASFDTPFWPMAVGNAVEIALGERFSCVRQSSGQVQCWGGNESGQLGDGNIDRRFRFATVSGVFNTVEIEAGSTHACARLMDGSVRCWGANFNGQLGIGSADAQRNAVTVGGLSGVLGLSAAAHHTCALLGDSSARCWGSNESGQLGDGTTMLRASPVRVEGLDNVVELALGGAPGSAARHSCARLRDGTARCWGHNQFGQLGDGSTTNRLSPVAVSSLNGAVEIVGGGLHNCARRTDGTVRCWGRNDRGQLGDGSTTDRPVPTPVAGLNGVVGIAAGASHTCALLTSGRVRCWGDNRSGQLGNGTAADAPLPVEVTGLAGVGEIAAGAFHTCARVADGSVRCWGSNDAGQVGDGSGNRYVPTAMRLPSDVVRCSVAPGEPTSEACGDGIDNDCDGVVDNGC